MKFLSWLIGLPLALIAIVFAVVNRTGVPVDLWPLPWTLELPLYILVLGALALGMIAGGVIVWLSAGRVRSKARREHRRARTLEVQVKALQENEQAKAAAPLPPQSAAPAKALAGR